MAEIIPRHMLLLPIYFATVATIAIMTYDAFVDFVVPRSVAFYCPKCAESLAVHTTSPSIILYKVCEDENSKVCRKVWADITPIGYFVLLGTLTSVVQHMYIIWVYWKHRPT